MSNKNPKEIAIEVKNISKSFRLPTEKSSSIKQTFVNWVRGVKGYKEQKVLRNISFNVEKGDFFGIVGRNGSGKSTLLKLISGIYEANGGSIKINGSLVSFIELGVGFNPELTGRENVYLNGALLGFSVKEIDAMYDEIVEFAELEEFMDQKLKNYSSGMQVRLAFSCAIRAKSDILVLDEVLAVGDEAFQRKCFQHFAELRRNKKTVILVTHSMDQVQQFCTRAIMIQNGKITHSGKTSDVAQAYREINAKDIATTSESTIQKDNKYKDVNVKAKYDNLREKLAFVIDVKSNINIDDAVITFTINRDNGEMVYRWVTDEKIKKIINISKGSILKLNLDLQNIFPNGVFDVSVGIKNRDRSKIYGMFSKIVKFEIINTGSFSGDIRWKPKEEYFIE